MAKSDDKADVWMPLYIGDYLADTTRLTTEQHGAYLLLIMDYWRNGPPPDEKIVLQNVTRLSDFLWKKHWPVLQKFFQLIDGHWHHKRIDAEMAEAVSGKAEASEKARKAAEARWGKKDAQSIPQAHAPEMLEECPSQSSSPSPVNPQDKTIGSVIASGDSWRDDAETPAADAMTIPASHADWCRYFAQKHGVEIDASNVHQRKKAWPLFTAWINARVSIGQMDRACKKARAESKGAIAFLPAYADTVLASMDAPARRPNPEEQRRLISEANGNAWLAQSGASDPNVIDMEH